MSADKLALGVGVVVPRPTDSGELLIVEEALSDLTLGKLSGMLSFPAGHVKVSEKETLVEAARREVREETGFHVDIVGLIGVYVVYTAALGFVFLGKITGARMISQTSGEIKDIHWMQPAELLGGKYLLRPAVRESLCDYLGGNLSPFDKDIQYCARE